MEGVFRPFTSREASDWLGDGGTPGDHLTLAELSRARGDIETITTDHTTTAPGNYL